MFFITILQWIGSFKKKKQHRCLDENYRDILLHLRHWKPTKRILNTLNTKALCRAATVDDAAIRTALQTHATATVITVSKDGAKRVNNVVVKRLFTQAQPLATIQLDNDWEPMPIYKDMRVIITQNVDKSKGIVNGRIGTIHMKSRNTILIKLPNQKIVPIYPRTNVVTINEDGIQRNVNKTVYPIVPGYAINHMQSTRTNIRQVHSLDGFRLRTYWYRLCSVLYV